MIVVNANIILSQDEVKYTFVRSSGPGGQNVNRVASAVQLRFNAAESPNLSSEVKVRLLKLAGARATANGEIVIDARRHRTQERNRADALARLIDLIERAAVRPARRRPTRPGKAAHRRRLQAKHHRSKIKAGRRRPGADD